MSFTPLFAYFLQGSLVTSCFLLFYKLLLRRETFFTWSRWFFLIAVAASFLFPLLDVSALLHRTAETPQLITYIPDLSFTTVGSSKSMAQQFLTQLLFAGMLLMLIRLLVQLAALLKLRRNNPVQQLNRIRIVELQERVNPFSFFHEIYVNPALHSAAELEEIIRHEEFHIRQKHTIDILLSELLTIVFWFNPFAWLLKNALKENLEFLTDKLVLQTGIDPRHYQYNLLKVSTLDNNISTANHFHFLKLKNRIVMMNKDQSAPGRLVKYLLLIPVVAVLLMAFSERKELVQVLQQKVAQDTLPVKTEEVKEILISVHKGDADSITTINVEKKKDTEQVTITLKNGKQEVYNLRNEKDRSEFEKKYGKLIRTDSITIKVPVPPAVSSPVSPAAPPPPPPPAEPVLNTKGYFISIADDKGECIVLVRDKTKKIVKALPLTEWDQNKSTLEKKYGTIPPVKETTVLLMTDASKDGPGNPYPSGDSKLLLKDGILIIVNEKEMPAGFDVNSINPEQIATIDVLKGDGAVQRYGEKGKNGVIEIRLKEGASQKITIKTTSPATKPLYVVNGKIVAAEEIKNINPKSILKVDVLKSENAIKIYGETAKDGVVIITTKE